MNFAVGFVILFCLFCSEYSAVGSAGHLRERIGGIVLLTCLVPALAMLQTFMVSRKVQRQEIDEANWERLCRRVSSCHTAVWLAASVATIYAFRWHDVVRAEWGLDRFVMVDEIIILGPVLLSLLASWAVFFDLKPKQEPKTKSPAALPLPAFVRDGSASQWSLSKFRAWLLSPERREFVSIRFRLYVLVLMVPLSLAIAVNDLAPMVQRLGPVAATILMVVGGLGTLALLPTLAGLPWKLAAPKDDVRTAIGQELSQFKLVGPKIRVWDTGNQIINAAAVGMVPWFRQLWVSDRLICLFPETELRAIVRHEVGHLQLGHAAIRSAVLLMPVTMVSLIGWLRWDDFVAVGKIASCVGASVLAVTAVMSILYLIYAMVALRTLSHVFEFEADLIACCKPLNEGEKIDARNRLEICPQRWSGMQAAIERLAICMPSQVDKKSVLHPSLRARMKALRLLRLRAKSCPPDQLIASNRRWIFGVSMFAASTIAVVIWAV